MLIVEQHEKLNESQRQEAVKFYADHAIKMLQTAVEKGYRDIAQLKRDADLATLCDREDFKKLIAELEKKGKLTEDRKQ